MQTLGFNGPLYVSPFVHRGSFETKTFGWHGKTTQEAAILEMPGRSLEFVGIFEDARVAQGVK